VELVHIIVLRVTTKLGWAHGESTAETVLYWLQKLFCSLMYIWTNLLQIKHARLIDLHVLYMRNDIEHVQCSNYLIYYCRNIFN
jgi:hypothetical protein